MEEEDMQRQPHIKIIWDKDREGNDENDWVLHSMSCELRKYKSQNKTAIHQWKHS